MGNQQRFSEQQGRRYTPALITGLIAGVIIQEWGWIHHNHVLAGLGLTVMLAPTIVAVTILPKEPPLPWRKEYVVALIAISLVAGCILWILGLNSSNYTLMGLGAAVDGTPLWLALIIERRKKARQKKQQATI